MTIPLPPTKKELTLPGRLADQNRRVRRKEGVILPNPRTYRYQRTGTIGTTSGTNNLNIPDANMPAMWIKPGEVFQVFMRIDLQASAASTSGRMRFNDDLLILNHIWYEAAISTSPTWDIVYTNAVLGGAKAIPANNIPGTPLTIPAVDYLTEPQTVSPLITVNRTAGAGNITARNFYMNVIIF